MGMADVYENRSQAWDDEWRREVAGRAVRAYKRAKVIRGVVICSALCLALARVVVSLVFAAPNDTILNSPPVWAVTLLASCLTCSLVWSTREHCKCSLADYAGSLRASLGRGALDRAFNG
jgi:hypothetical protein